MGGPEGIPLKRSLGGQQGCTIITVVYAWAVWTLIVFACLGAVYCLFGVQGQQLSSGELSLTLSRERESSSSLPYLR